MTVMPFDFGSVSLNTSTSSAGLNLLTKRKYCGPSLHQVIGERTMAPRTTRAGVTKSLTHSIASKTKSEDDYKHAIQDEMDVFAQPLSSDEEEKRNVSSTSSSPAAKKMTTRPKFSPPKPVVSPPTKLIKKKAFAAVPDALDLDDLFSSQPKKKRKVDYSTRNIHTADVKVKAEVETKPETGFAIPAALPIVEESLPGTEFKIPQPVTASSRRSKRNSSKDTSFQPPPTNLREEPASAGPVFKMPTMLYELDSSAPSFAESVFDIPEPSQEARRRRSGSSSSLSSHSSVDLNLTLEEQLALAHDDTGDGLDNVEKAKDRCYMCGDRVALSLYNEFKARYKHPFHYRVKEKLHDAHKRWHTQQKWTEKGYPTIDWEILEADRIPRHIRLLTKILRRKSPSFYRDKLDSVANDSKSSRKALHHYLKDAVIDVAKQGYYGPRGARVMGHAITTTMENALKAALKLDKVVTAAGVGGYVSAVLVPELMVELVKEDMRVKTDVEARQILERSTEDGAVMNPDDDEVVLRADDDE